MDPSSGNIGAAPALQDNAAETRFNQLEQTLENFQVRLALVKLRGIV